MNCIRITSVALPSKVSYVGDKAFFGCTGLKKVTINTEVLTTDNFGADVFGGCTALNKVTIAGEAVKIGEDAFAQVPDKAKFKITTKNKAAKDEIIRNLLLYIDTFTDAKNNVYILITDETFEAYLTGTNDAAAKSIKVPDAVTYRGLAIPVIGIQESAFKDNTAITTVTIGKNVRTIDNQAFEGCSNLKTVTIKSKNLILIGYKAFYGNSPAATYKISDKTKLAAYKQLLIDAGVEAAKIK